MSNFDKVVDFNKTFGVTVHDTPQKDIFKTDPKLVDLRLKLIVEEVEELQEALKNHDMVETIDALSDILYVVYGAGASFGIDLDKTFDLVHESNMSKACSTEEVAERTVQWYKDNSESYNQKNPAQAPVDPAWRIINGKYIVYNKLTGKVLKSVEYNAVSFKEYLSA